LEFAPDQILEVPVRKFDHASAIRDHACAGTSLLALSKLKRSVARCARVGIGETSVHKIAKAWSAFFIVHLPAAARAAQRE
jgi:hypothetical protein